MRESAAIALPDNVGAVTFVRDPQQLVAFMGGAYDRMVIYRRTGEQSRSWKLPVDAGYNMWIDAYWISDGEKMFLRFVDQQDEYLLDLKSNKLLLVATIQGVRYAGPMGNATFKVVASGLREKGSGARDVQIYGSPAFPLTTIVADPQGTYLGRVWGSGFTPASAVSGSVDANVASVEQSD